MYLLRRATGRAISATPAKSLLAQPRSLTTVTRFPLAFRYQKWTSTKCQRRFASDDVARSATQSSESSAQTAAETPIDEDSAQTAAQTPIDEDSAQTAAQTPIDEDLTAAQDAKDDMDVFEDAPKPRRSGGHRAMGYRRHGYGADITPVRTVFVGNLYFEVTADQLKTVFSRFGEVENVSLVRDKDGNSRGFGYIQYKTIDEAQSAIDNLDAQIFEGRDLVVQFHQPGPNSKSNALNIYHKPNPPSKTIFIGNMSFEMSDKDLSDIFRELHNIEDVRVAIDRRTGQPRGFAHADFTDVPSAVRAKEILQEKILYGRQLRVDFSISKPKNRTMLDDEYAGGIDSMEGSDSSKN